MTITITTAHCCRGADDLADPNLPDGRHVLADDAASRACLETVGFTRPPVTEPAR